MSMVFDLHIYIMLHVDLKPNTEFISLLAVLRITHKTLIVYRYTHGLFRDVLIATFILDGDMNYILVIYS